MATDLTTSSSTRIEAPIDEVWRALTTPALIERWFLGVETIADWTQGGSIVHRGSWRGEPYEDKGTIVRIEPPRLLIHTHWSPRSGLPDLPEHYQEVTWSLDDVDGSTRLTVDEANLPSEDAKAVSERTWPMVLGNLKELLEG
jgi:uncharacterized protein YndB with AHSA1/START domain